MWFTLPLDVIWKHQMGERHWTFVRLIVHTFVLKWAVFFLMMLAYPDLLVPAPGDKNLRAFYRQELTLVGFIAVIWIFGLANLWEIRKRKKAGIQWHTEYWGRPRFLPDKTIVHCLIIPIGSGLLAYGAYRLLPPLGIYLFLMAACQLVGTTDYYRADRVEKLNRRDREIQLKIKNAELEDAYRGPLGIVRVAKPSQRMRLSEENALFETRWKNVLKSSDSQKQ